jgi:hypothetical protein
MYEPPEGPLVWTAADLGPGSGPGRRPFVRPLPDPVAIRIRAIPDAAPPYDEDEPAEGDADGFAAAIMVALGRSDPASAGEPAGTGEPGSGGEPGRTGEPAGTEPVGGDRPGESRAPGRAFPAGPAWPSRFAQVLAETLAGSRPPAQLVPWTTERARSHIRRLGPMLMGERQPVVRRVVTSWPAAGVLEMSVVVGLGPRVHALAIRLERERSPRPLGPGHRTVAGGRPVSQARWLCTAVEAA